MIQPRAGARCCVMEMGKSSALCNEPEFNAASEIVNCVES